MPKGAGRRRADQVVADAGLADSRTRAQALIMAGRVYAGDRQVRKPGDLISSDATLRLTGQDHPWVSRGGLKLQKALHHFGFDPNGVVAIDVGSSTGGFTDVLLAHGAARVYAVDVGRAQLAWTLREDPRVVVLEGRNARTLRDAEIPEPIDAFVCDASFIGLAKVLARPLDFAGPNAWAAALVKPQFEVGPQHVGAGGVVRDAQARADACAAAAGWLDGLPGWSALGVVESPIRGAKGNVEYLLGGRRG